MASTSVKEALAGTAGIGSEVTVKGWVRTRRDSSALSFVHVSDASCFAPIQVVATGDLANFESEVRRLSAGCAVVAVDYRMGPEVRFPGAVNDVLAATRWAASQAKDLRIDPARLAVGGDSAGGNLAAVVSIAARDDADGRGPLPIAFQLLIYPGTDMRRGHASHTSNGQGYVLTADTITYFHDHYIDDARHDVNWRASPLLAASHAGLPPALVITAGYDPLRDEGLDYARALSADGTRVSYVCFERQIHGFITMGRVLDEAHTAVALCAAELRRALAAPAPG